MSNPRLENCILQDAVLRTKSFSETGKTLNLDLKLRPENIKLGSLLKSPNVASSTIKNATLEKIRGNALNTGSYKISTENTMFTTKLSSKLTTIPSTLTNSQSSTLKYGAKENLQSNTLQLSLSNPLATKPQSLKSLQSNVSSTLSAVHLSHSLTFSSGLSGLASSTTGIKLSLGGKTSTSKVAKKPLSSRTKTKTKLDKIWQISVPEYSFELDDETATNLINFFNISAVSEPGSLTSHLLQETETVKV